MYTLVRSLVKRIGQNTPWETTNIGDVALYTVFDTYSKVYAVLTHPSVETEITLDLDLIKGEVQNSILTFNAFLASIGNRSLPTITMTPEIGGGLAKFKDAVQAGFKIHTTTLDNPITSPYLEDERDHLVLVKTGIDYRKLYDHVLVNVNGFYHSSDTNNQGLYVIDGDISRDISGMNYVGLYNFEAVGKLTHIPLTQSMLTTDHEDEVYRVYITLPEDIGDKQAFLVLGGYLIALDDDVLNQNGNRGLAVNLTNYPLVERYFESRKYIDLAGLEIDLGDDNDHQIAPIQLRTKETLLKYFTLSQSFVVLVDAEGLQRESLSVVREKIPNRFISHIKPDYPLVVGFGKHDSYWSVEDSGQWAIYANDTVEERLTFQTTDMTKLETLDDALDPGSAVRFGYGHWLSIRSQTVVWKEV